MKPGHARTLHVLLAESDHAHETTLKRALSEISEFVCDVVSCERADDTLEICRRDPPDVLLLGAHLRDMAALDLLVELSDPAHAPAVPVIVLTGAGDDGAAAMRLGAQDRLDAAELTPPVLVRSIRYAIERHALLQELAQLRSGLTPAPTERAAIRRPTAPAPVVLVVGGDGTAHGEAIARGLERVTHDVRRAGAGDALEHLAERHRFVEPGSSPRPGLIVLDGDAPGAPEILAALEDDTRFRRLPVVVVGSAGEQAAIDRWYRCGASSYVRRPAGEAPLAEAVERLARYWLEIAVLPRPGAAPATRRSA